MICHEFSYLAPDTIDEALELIAPSGEDRKLLAGGMSMVPTMTLGLAATEVLVSLKRLKTLSFITVLDDEVRVGAMTTHTMVADSPEIAEALPVLADCASLIGDVQVRNRGTVGGSVAHADPAGNYPPLLMALGASMVVRSAAAERIVYADDFFLGFMTTAVGEGDILTEVRIPRPGRGAGAAYDEFVRVEGNFATVNACAVVHSDGTGTVGLGGVGSVPAKVDLAGVFDGDAIDRPELDARVDAATTGGFADIHASVEYKRSLARTFAARSVSAAASRARSNGQGTHTQATNAQATTTKATNAQATNAQATNAQATITKATNTKGLR